MAWPSDTLTNIRTDDPTDRPDLARAEIDSCILKVKDILAEAPAGSSLLTNQDEGPGNGLDADTLDGNHASAFATASHVHPASDINSGIFPIVRGGTGRSTLLQYATLCGNGSAAVTQVTPSTAGRVLMSNGPSSFPSYQDLPTTIDGSNFYDEEKSLLGTSGVWDWTFNTGLGTNDISWGVTGIKRTDGNSDTITGFAIDGAGFSRPVGGGTGVTNTASSPITGRIRVRFTYVSGGAVGFEVRVWARNNL